MTTISDLFLCQNVEEGCKSIDLNSEIVNQLSGDEILQHIEKTFKIERTESGVLKKYVN